MTYHIASRRNFLVQAAGTAAIAAFAGSHGLAAGAKAAPFNLGFAPHSGMFKDLSSNDMLDQIRFAHDQGFTAWEHNGMAKETPEQQERIGALLDELGMQMGVFVAYADFEHPSFAVKNAETRTEVLTAIEEAVVVAQRCNAKYFTVVPGSVDQQSSRTDNWNRYGGGRLSEGYQLANVIDLLRECASLLEPHSLTMVLEPLNWHANHGGVFLERSDQAYAICRAVNSPSCKILFDIYHQQITEGNLIPNIEMCWDEIGYFQSGDNPGRKEPGTGEINYSKVFQFIYDLAQKTDRDFIIGMEHGNSMRGADGAQAVIDAYRKVDAKK